MRICPRQESRTGSVEGLDDAPLDLERQMVYLGIAELGDLELDGLRPGPQALGGDVAVPRLSLECLE